MIIMKSTQKIKPKSPFLALTLTVIEQSSSWVSLFFTNYIYWQGDKHSKGLIPSLLNEMNNSHKLKLKLGDVESLVFVDSICEIPVYLVDENDNLMHERVTIVPTCYFFEPNAFSSDNSHLQSPPPSFCTFENVVIEDAGNHKLYVKFHDVSLSFDNRKVFIQIDVDHSHGDPLEILSVKSSPIVVYRQKLIIEEEFNQPYVWYKDEGGKDKCIELKVSLIDQNNEKVFTRKVPLKVTLLYAATSQHVADQSIMALLHDSRTVIEDQEAFVKYRVNEVSNRHQGQLFQVMVAPDLAHYPSLGDIHFCLSTAIDVKSKRNHKEKERFSGMRGGYNDTESNATKRIKSVGTYMLSKFMYFVISLISMYVNILCLYLFIIENPQTVGTAVGSYFGSHTGPKPAPFNTMLPSLSGSQHSLAALAMFSNPSGGLLANPSSTTDILQSLSNGSNINLNAMFPTPTGPPLSSGSYNNAVFDSGNSNLNFQDFGANGLLNIDSTQNGEPLFPFSSNIGIDESSDNQQALNNIIQWTKLALQAFMHIQWQPIGYTDNDTNQPLYNIPNPTAALQLVFQQYQNHVESSIQLLQSRGHIQGISGDNLGPSLSQPVSPRIDGFTIDHSPSSSPRRSSGNQTTNIASNSNGMNKSTSDLFTLNNPKSPRAATTGASRPSLVRSASGSLTSKPQLGRASSFFYQQCQSVAPPSLLARSHSLSLVNPVGPNLDNESALFVNTPFLARSLSMTFGEFRDINVHYVVAKCFKSGLNEVGLPAFDINKVLLGFYKSVEDIDRTTVPLFASLDEVTSSINESTDVPLLTAQLEKDLSKNEDHIFMLSKCSSQADMIERAMIFDMMNNAIDADLLFLDGIDRSARLFTPLDEPEASSNINKSVDRLLLAARPEKDSHKNGDHVSKSSSPPDMIDRAVVFEMMNSAIEEDLLFFDI